VAGQHGREEFQAASRAESQREAGQERTGDRQRQTRPRHEQEQAEPDRQGEVRFERAGRSGGRGAHAVAAPGAQRREQQPGQRHRHELAQDKRCEAGRGE